MRLTLDQYADLWLRVQCGMPLDEVLQQANVTLDIWMEAHELWQTGAELNPETHRQVESALLAARDRLMALAAPPPASPPPQTNTAPLPPAPSSDRDVVVAPPPTVPNVQDDWRAAPPVAVPDTRDDWGVWDDPSRNPDSAPVGFAPEPSASSSGVGTPRMVEPSRVAAAPVEASPVLALAAPPLVPPQQPVHPAAAQPPVHHPMPPDQQPVDQRMMAPLDPAALPTLGGLQPPPLARPLLLEHLAYIGALLTRYPEQAAKTLEHFGFDAPSFHQEEARWRQIWAGQPWLEERFRALTELYVRGG